MARYHRPTALSEALAIRAAEPVTIMAGGTDIYPAHTVKASWGSAKAPDVLDITAVPELRGITDHGDQWRLGATTTWTDLIRADLPALFDGYKAAARDVGGVQIQNRGTLAGNIVTASPAGDGIPNLMVLEADVELASQRGQRRVPIGDFIDDYRHTVLGADEIVTGLLIPKASAGARGGFVKLGARRYLVISIVMAAGVIAIEDGVITDARLALGACSAVARRQAKLEKRLLGLSALDASRLDIGSEDLNDLSPIDDVRASAAYRAEAAIAAIRDLIARLVASQNRRAA